MDIHTLALLAETNPQALLPLAVAGAGAALGIGMIGAKAAEGVARNPEAASKVQTVAIIGMALAEAVAIYALIIALIK